MRYDDLRREADPMLADTQGKLADKPLAELIRELGESSESGALRLSRERAKAVVYFDEGTLVFAASNMRAHRLPEFLKRNGLLNDESLSQVPPTATDEELLDFLVAQGKTKPEQIPAIRANHVTDILRALLLWTEGHWQFDARVRLTANTRTSIDAKRLLLEATRHLPSAYVASRFPDATEQIKPAQSNGHSARLLPQEAFVASRLGETMTIAELQTVSGLGEEETLRAVYALAMAGVITRGTWGPKAADGQNEKSDAPASSEPEAPTVEDFMARVGKASNHYDVLGIERGAEINQIKAAYHSLARRYHPDRFHQAEAPLRARIESAFARIARAYETLSDTASRAAYDAQGGTAGSADPQNQTPDERAAASFEKGLAALKQNQSQQAVRFFAEAASIHSRCARYRAEYGRALSRDPQTRRSAEIELKAAIALEPTNAAYRVMLAELYKVLGLRRRAEAEVQRALMSDPKSEAARTLLASLKN